ncbi:hypothetical protein [Alkaliphilus peptidifermentans]|uniref:Copper amine oxidase N-terminal domain-containing protein n=1 Tax=Alkaliphilus peptidifermentans DSM 18978 TaxID=1120976 RepID=A0A1G5AP32_9FIRM|nr:hypothetical protein [Alkaliphilus peptidifermentans]SCX79612.1 hypothetical protein SAMN03080606_00230 [Alkaliphilus peptidifermentans DSM 18978]
MKKTIAKVLTVIMILGFSLASVSAATPPGLEKKGGLPPGLQKKDELPPGIQKRFVIPNENKLTFEATIVDIDIEEKRIVVKDGTALIHLLVSDKAKIELNDAAAKLADLRKGDEVYLKLDDKNTIIEIKATAAEGRETILEGEIVSIDSVKKEFVLKHQDKRTLIKVDSDTVIKEGRTSKSFSDLKINMDVKVTVKEEKVVLIEINPIEYTKITGTIYSINLKDKELIIREGNTSSFYRLNSDTAIYVDNTKKILSDLKVDMTVEAYVDGITLKTLYATDLNYTMIEAVIKSVDTAKSEMVLEYNNKQELFNVDKNATIKINGINHVLSDLKADMQVKVKVQSDKIVEVTVLNDIVVYEGRLLTLQTGNTPTVTVEINNESKYFNVDKNVNLTDITVGNQVKIYVRNSVVIAIHEK